MATPVTVVSDSGRPLENRHVSVTPVCDTNAYTAGDVLFDRVAIPNATPGNDIPAVLTTVLLLDEDDNTAANITLIFLDADVSLGAANSAPDISDGSARNVMALLVLPSGNFVDLGGAKIVNTNNLNMVLKPAAGTSTIYVAAICAGTPTQTASGIKLRFGFRGQ